MHSGVWGYNACILMFVVWMVMDLTGNRNRIYASDERLRYTEYKSSVTEELTSKNRSVDN